MSLQYPPFRSGAAMKNLFYPFLVVLAVTVVLPTVGYNMELQDRAKSQERFNKGPEDGTLLGEWKLRAEHGDAVAQKAIGLMYSSGFPGFIPEDHVRAYVWLKLAASQGYGPSNEVQRRLERNMTPAEIAEAERRVTEWKPTPPKSNRGLVFSAARASAVLSLSGISIQEMEDLAEQGDAATKYRLGEMYLEGKVIPQDYAKAMKWARPAAEQGYADAQVMLGWMYDRGAGVPEDDAEAFKWYRLAAEQGDAHGQYRLGYMHRFVGTGPLSHDGYQLKNPQDHVDAVKWYRLAADQGYTEAQHRLGESYMTGDGVPKDRTKAIFWYRLVADQGEANVQYYLGSLYDQGFGVPQDNIEAMKWFRLAADQGHKAAIKSLEIRETKAASAAKTAPASPILQKVTNTFPTNPIDVFFRSSPAQPDDIAVIIGNANYKKLGRDIPNVIPAYADAEGMRYYVKQALGIVGDNIIFLKDATQKDMIGTFGNATNYKGRLFRYLTKGSSRIFIFYSGHGAPGSDGTNFLVPTDAESSLIELNGYPLSTLYRNLSRLPAKSVTVVLEACFSGASDAGAVIRNASGIYLKARKTGIPPNVTVIAAGAANQIASWEKDRSHGLFTKYFLMGMSGEADNDNDHNVSWAELKDYLAKTVTRSAMRNYGREQTPQIVVGSGG